MNRTAPLLTEAEAVAVCAEPDPADPALPAAAAIAFARRGTRDAALVHAVRSGASTDPLLDVILQPSADQNLHGFLAAVAFARGDTSTAELYAGVYPSDRMCRIILGHVAAGTDPSRYREAVLRTDVGQCLAFDG